MSASPSTARGPATLDRGIGTPASTARIDRSAGGLGLGATPRDLIYTHGTSRLYRYRPLGDEVYRVPLLFVMSLITKPYILDLLPGQSLIEYLLQRGYDVYLIDWGIPRAEDAHLTLEDYVLEFLPECVSQVQRQTNETDVNVVGYCLGGLLAVLHEALQPESPVCNLVCLTTPVDFTELTLFSRWSQRSAFDVDRLIATLGNVPPQLLQGAFEMLRPAQRLAARARSMSERGNSDALTAPLAIEHWARDHIPFPGACFKQVTERLLQGNELVRGTFTLAGRSADLGAVRLPLLHVMAEHDHIVPPASGRPLVQLVGSKETEEFVLKGGHVSLIAGANARHRLWPRLDRWLSVRSA